MAKSTPKVSVINPITGEKELVSSKQYARYGEKYFYNREYDRIRKSKVLSQSDKALALKQVKRVERGEVIVKQRVSEIFIKERKKSRTKKISIGDGTLKVEALQQKLTTKGRIDERSGLTMLAAGNRQAAYDIMQELNKYGLGSSLQKLHKGEYRYSEVIDNEIFDRDIQELDNAYNTGGFTQQMDSETYEQLRTALINLIS